MRKDNTGYHLKNLFIGSEGTLGIVTGVSIATVRIRKAVNVFMIALQSFEDVTKLFAAAKRDLSETIAAFEVMDNETIHVVKEQDFQVPKGSEFPISDQHPFYVTLETAGTEPEIERVVCAYNAFTNSVQLAYIFCLLGNAYLESREVSEYHAVARSRVARSYCTDTRSSMPGFFLMHFSRFLC